MKVIIPLAGLGTRLRPHTYTKPKPLINVAGKPMLAHILDKFRGIEVEEYIFIVGYLGDQIEKYVSQQYGFKARYVDAARDAGPGARAVAVPRLRGWPGVHGLRRHVF